MATRKLKQLRPERLLDSDRDSCRHGQEVSSAITGTGGPPRVARASPGGMQRGRTGWPYRHHAVLEMVGHRP
jgi:hypothetical protein